MPGERVAVTNRVGWVYTQCTSNPLLMYPLPSRYSNPKDTRLNKKSPEAQKRHKDSKVAQVVDSKMMYHGLGRACLQGRYWLEIQSRLMQGTLLGATWLGNVNRRINILALAEYRRKRDEFRACEPELKARWVKEAKEMCKAW